VLPLSIWLLRNYLVAATLTGDRVPSRASLLNSIYLTADIITRWFLPGSLPGILRVVVISFLIISAAIIISLAVRKDLSSLKTISFWQIIPLILFVVIYIAFLLFSVTTTALSPVDNRYLSPIYAPLILLSVFIVDRIKSLSPNLFGRQVVQRVLLIGLSLWLIYPTKNTIQLLNWYFTQGVGGFHTSSWVNSDLIAYLRSHKLEGLVYTNEPQAVYALTGNVFKGSPRKYAYESVTPTDDLSKFDQILQANGQLYLVMFDGTWWQGYLFDAEFFKANYDLEEIAKRTDGVIYRVEFRKP
jgi:hypothetical protein